MTNHRIGGLALIAGSLGTIVTMSIHPSARELFTPGQLERMTRINLGAHTLALVCLPVLLFGALILSHRMDFDDPPVMPALITYVLGGVSAMNAAVLSGLVAPAVAREMVSAAPTADTTWRVAFQYSGELNQAFALVFVVASSVAIALWSISILRSHILSLGAGIYGCILAAATLFMVLPGHLRLNVHGFGAIVFGQAIWFIIVGAALWRDRGARAPSV